MEQETLCRTGLSLYEGICVDYCMGHAPFEHLCMLPLCDDMSLGEWYKRPIEVLHARTRRLRVTRMQTEKRQLSSLRGQRMFPTI